MVRGISQKTKQKREGNRDSAKGPKRTPDEVLRDRADIARMRLSGFTQAEIAKNLIGLRDYSLSQPTICADLKVVRSEWLKGSTEDYEKTRLIELSRLNEEERIAIEGWNSSKVKRKERTRTGTNDDKRFEEFMEEVETGSGNPAFLQRLESIRLRRCRILGFEAHQRSENINAAIDTLLAAGYIVRLPEDENAES